MSSEYMSRPKLIEIVNLNNKENSSTLLLQMKRQQQQQHRMKCAKHFQSQYSLPLMISSACSSSRSSPLSMSPLPSLTCAFFPHELFDYQSDVVNFFEIFQLSNFVCVQNCCIWLRNKLLIKLLLTYVWHLFPSTRNLWIPYAFKIIIIKQNKSGYKFNYPPN